MRVHRWTCFFVLFLWTCSAVVESANGTQLPPPLMCFIQLTGSGFKVLSVCSNCTHTTINSAVVSAGPGDIIIIAPGNYNEPQTSIGFPLTFQYTHFPKMLATLVGRSILNIISSILQHKGHGWRRLCLNDEHILYHVANNQFRADPKWLVHDQRRMYTCCPPLFLLVLPLNIHATTGLEVPGALYQYGTLIMVPAIRGT
jgi:hypothetical protein